MDLIKRNKCGEEVSNFVATCPKCGGRRVHSKDSAIIIALILWGLLASYIALSNGGVPGLSGSTMPRQEVTNATISKTMPRQEFTDAVISKTQSEVISSVGKPNTTSGSDSENWFYHKKTVDPITSVIDHNALVVFRNGVVDHVVY